MVTGPKHASTIVKRNRLRNPARSLGPALLAGGNALGSVWIYLLAPAVGALLGSLVYEVMRGSQENAKEVMEEPPIKKFEVVEIKKNEEDIVKQV